MVQMPKHCIDSQMTQRMNALVDSQRACACHLDQLCQDLLNGQHALYTSTSTRYMLDYVSIFYLGIPFHALLECASEWYCVVARRCFAMHAARI